MTLKFEEPYKEKDTTYETIKDESTKQNEVEK